MSRKWVVEVMETPSDELGRPQGVVWRTDCVTSPRLARDRWSELANQGKAARLLDRRGVPAPVLG